MGGIVVPGQPHHVVQRRSNRQDVLFVDDQPHPSPIYMLRARDVPGDGGVSGWSRERVGPIWPTVPIGSIAPQLFPAPDEFGKPRDSGR